MCHGPTFGWSQTWWLIGFVLPREGTYLSVVLSSCTSVTFEFQSQSVPITFSIDLWSSMKTGRIYLYIFFVLHKAIMSYEQLDDFWSSFCYNWMLIWLLDNLSPHFHLFTILVFFLTISPFLMICARTNLSSVEDRDSLLSFCLCIVMKLEKWLKP